VAHSEERAMAQRSVDTSLVRVDLLPIYPDFSIIAHSRNVVNLLLYLAEHCNYYYPKQDIPAMLETFIPLTTQDVRMLCFDSPLMILNISPVNSYHDSSHDLFPSS
jgi:hypothetical protein